MSEASIEQFLEENKSIQKNIFDYLDYDIDIEEKYQNLKNLFDDIKIHSDQYKIKLLFKLIVQISNNHHRERNFFSKIDQILLLFKDDIQNYFSNSEIYHIFRSNKRLLLYLIEEKIMTIDEAIVKRIIKDKIYINEYYLEYFHPEIQPFSNEKWLLSHNEKENEDRIFQLFQKEFPTDFYENRKIGENNERICQLIQKDLIDEFITYVNKNDYPLKSSINTSIYETNSILLKKKRNKIN